MPAVRAENIVQQLMQAAIGCAGLSMTALFHVDGAVHLVSLSETPSGYHTMDLVTISASRPRITLANAGIGSVGIVLEPAHVCVKDSGLINWVDDSVNNFPLIRVTPYREGPTMWEAFQRRY